MQLSIIQRKIYEIRGQRVMLDVDLVKLYEVETIWLKEAVKRNRLRFPADFMFQLSEAEWEIIKSKNTALNRCVTRYIPLAFTEQGVGMLSGILNSEQAVRVNIAILRTFALTRQYAGNDKKLHRKLQRLEKKYNQNFKEICDALNRLFCKKRQPGLNKRIGNLLNLKYIPHYVTLQKIFVR